MNYSFIVFIIFILSVANIRATDTTYYSNGIIKSILYKNDSYKKFDSLGILREHFKAENFLCKGKQLTYNDKGFLISKSKFVFFNLKHGKTVIYQNEIKRKTKYRYGEEKTSLLNKEGRKIKLILTYGKPMHHPRCEELEIKYRFKYKRVAGCMINRNIKSKTKLHNTFVKIQLILQHGFNWKSQSDEFCKIKYQEFK